MESASMQNYSFLIVEDDPNHSRQYQNMINKVTKKLKASSNIEEVDEYGMALKRINKKRYDVLVIDRKILGGKGDDLVEKVKSIYPFQRMLFITAYPAISIREKVELSNIFAYIERKGDYREEFENSLTKLLTCGIHCFIITPFRKRYLKFCNDTIKPYISNLGFKPILASDIFQKDTILKKVILGIEKSYFVISDISEKNANVFFETGIGYEMKKPIIFITRKPNNMPSDLKDQYYFKYSRRKKDAFTMTLLEKIKAVEADFFSNLG